MKNKKRLIGLLVFATALMVVSISKAQTKTPHAMQSAINCGTDSKPCFIRNLPTEKSPDEIREEKEKDSSDWWLVILTAVLAGIGFLQFFVFILQLRAFRSQERTIITTSRPYLLWEKFENLHGLDPVTGKHHHFDALIDNAKNEKIVIADLSLKNCGGSPAFLRAYSVHFQMLEKLPEFPDYGDNFEILNYELAIPPQGANTRRKSLDKGRINGIDREAILKGEKHLFMWGMVEYVSHFDKQRVYKSRFALKWEFTESGKILNLESVKNKHYWEYT